MTTVQVGQAVAGCAQVIAIVLGVFIGRAIVDRQRRGKP